MNTKTQSSGNAAGPAGFGPNEGIASLFQPDALLVDQYFENFRRKSPLEPEKTLFLAVLEDGIRCFQDNVLTRDDKKKILFQEAELWIFGPDSDSIFSFASVCGFLGLDPEYIQRGLRNWEKRARGDSQNKKKPFRNAAAARGGLNRGETP